MIGKFLVSDKILELHKGKDRMWKILNSSHWTLLDDALIVWAMMTMVTGSHPSQCRIFPASITVPFIYLEILQ